MKKKLKRLKAGIAEFDHEQKVILRILRMSGGIYDGDFDRIFSDTGYKIDPITHDTVHYRRPIRKLRFLGASGDTFILGGMDFGYYNKWLELIQIMCVIGLVKTSVKNDNLFYELDNETKSQK